MPFRVGLHTVALRRYRGNGRVYVSQIPNALYVESKRNLTFLSPKFVPPTIYLSQYFQLKALGDVNHLTL